MFLDFDTGSVISDRFKMGVNFDSIKVSNRFFILRGSKKRE